MLCFFFSMLITNDVALIVFVPFTLALLSDMGCQKYAIPVIVLQTVAANLGSMATPVGNPQNLFLYAAFDLNAGEFFSVVLPLAALSLAVLTAASAPAQPTDNKMMAHAALQELGYSQEEIDAMIASGAIAIKRKV